MASTGIIQHAPLQTWSKASEDTSNHCWGLALDAHTDELKVSRIYKIK